ncbi:MAG: PDZ domain-containing protein [Acidobacteria bacterium]|nr:PDZ domain-containing protein [Acidobacteriota bacterium]
MRASALAALTVAISIPALLLGARGSSPHAPAIGSMGGYAEILAKIEERFVPAPDPKKVIYSSISGMLDQLDPHTNFLDDEAYREMREEQRGVFYGLGIVISKRGRYQPLRVIAPMAGTPADRMGIRGGDVITHIRDARAEVDIETLELTIQEAVKYLRGPRGTTVEVTIDRPGLDEPLQFSLVRDAIRTPAVNQAFMIRPETGYIHISNFTETTTTEFDEAVDKLRREGARRLVLDLTGNPGGLLEQAIKISSRFLNPGELVVYTEGRMAGSRQDYPSLRDVPKVEWPVVVLVDRESASASEIVSGALQDHDRAIVVGETTFGKGLVQSVYPLSENCGLALTTQKYYTPVGRSIQRPYSNDEEEAYFLELRDRKAVPQPESNSPVFRTDTGRIVYGGGGITPDIPVEVPDPPEVILQITRTSGFSRFVTGLDAAQREKLKTDPGKLLDAFGAFAAREIAEVKADELQAAREDVLTQLQGELALAEGGMSARERVLLEKNRALLKALESFSDAERLQARRRETQKRAAVAGSGS